MVSRQDWVKEHKKVFAAKIIEESGAVSDGKPSAIFMAGLPGSGKTEFSKNLIETSDLKVVRMDMDEIAEQIDGYKPENADQFRGGASELLNRVFDETIRRKLDFIMDGTFGSPNAIKNVERALKHSYRIKIVYILQDPKLAWKFTLAREKVEHRAISLEGFVDSYFNTINNIRYIMNMGYEKLSVDLIVKNDSNKIDGWWENVNLNNIDSILNNCYNKESLRKYIND